MCKLQTSKFWSYKEILLHHNSSRLISFSLVSLCLSLLQRPSVLIQLHTEQWDRFNTSWCAHFKEKAYLPMFTMTYDKLCPCHMINSSDTYYLRYFFSSYLCRCIFKSKVNIVFSAIGIYAVCMCIGGLERAVLYPFFCSVEGDVSMLIWVLTMIMLRWALEKSD